MPMKKKLVSTFKNPSKESPPLWIMRQAGRYLPEYHAVRNQQPDFIKLCLSPDLVTELTLQPIERFHFDGAVIFSDILLIPHALGQEVSFSPKPQLKPLDLAAMESCLSLDGFLTTLQPVYDALGQVKALLLPETSLIGFAGAPWTLGEYMVGGNPDKLREILSLLVVALTVHLHQQLLAGADVVQIFDSASASCPPELREEFIIQPISVIVEALQEEFPEVPIIYYSRGVPDVLVKLNHLLPQLVLGLDPDITPAWVKENLAPDVAIQGNLDPHILIQGGEALQHAVAAICEGFKDHRFVFNLGHGIRPETPLEHVYQLVSLLRG